MFRTPSEESLSFSDLRCQVPDVDIETSGSGKDPPSLRNPWPRLSLKKHGVTLLAIRRAEQTLSNPDANTVIRAGDLLVALSQPSKLAGFAQLFLDGQKGDGNECYLPQRSEHAPESQKERP